MTKKTEQPLEMYPSRLRPLKSWGAKIARDAPLMFPPTTPEPRRATELIIGNRVSVVGREDLGVGVVLDIEPDGRLARVNFGSLDSWWSRCDLRKD